MAESWSQMLFKTMTAILLILDEDTLILPCHDMDGREADDNLIFAAPMGKIKAHNADIDAIDHPRRFLRLYPGQHTDPARSIRSDP